MNRYTVTWARDAEDNLARLWNRNPRLRMDITAASDDIDRLLARAPLELGMTRTGRTREFVVPPLHVLYSVSEDDRRVNVMYVKLQYE